MVAASEVVMAVVMAVPLEVMKLLLLLKADMEVQEIMVTVAVMAVVTVVLPVALKSVPML